MTFAGEPPHATSDGGETEHLDRPITGVMPDDDLPVTDVSGHDPEVAEQYAEQAGTDPTPEQISRYGELQGADPLDPPR